MRTMAMAFLAVALFACSAWADYRIDEAVYSKLILFKGHVIYVQAEGDTLRFAPTPEALKDAPPTKGVPEEDGIVFRDVAIPLPAEALPEGFTASGQFFFAPAPVKDEEGRDHVIPWTHGKVWLSKTDDQNVKWTCVFRAGAGVDKNMVPDLDKAPEVEADLSQGVRLDLAAFSENAFIRAGVALMSGDVQLENILRDGKPTSVQITLLGPDGKEIESKTGTLRDFVLSPGGNPRYAVRAAGPGEYTCQAVMDGGAMGTIKAETKIIVPENAQAAYALDKPIYAKLIFFPNVVIYAQAEGDTLRFAPTPEGLKDVPPVKGVPERNGLRFNDLAIPLPSGAVPRGFTGAGGRFHFYSRRASNVNGRFQLVPCTYATIWLSSLDDRNVKWNYLFPTGQDMAPELDTAPEVQVNLSKGLKLDIAAMCAGSRVYAGLHLQSGGLPMEDITRDGTPASVQVTLFDPDGKEIESKAGALSDFGFS